MPYLTFACRVAIDDQIDDLVKQIQRQFETDDLGGALNYAFTRIIHDVLLGDGARYRDYERAVGTLESVKLELYTHHVRKYEDLKIAENGDVP
jgi:hypothetical protein